MQFMTGGVQYFPRMGIFKSKIYNFELFSDEFLCTGYPTELLWFNVIHSKSDKHIV